MDKYLIVIKFRHDGIKWQMGFFLALDELIMKIEFFVVAVL